MAKYSRYRPRDTTADLIKALGTCIKRMKRAKARPEALSQEARGIASLEDSLRYNPQWPNDRELCAMVGRIRSPEGSPQELALLLDQLGGAIGNSVKAAGIEPTSGLWAEAVNLGREIAHEAITGRTFAGEASPRVWEPAQDNKGLKSWVRLCVSRKVSNLRRDETLAAKHPRKLFRKHIASIRVDAKGCQEKQNPRYLCEHAEQIKISGEFLEALKRHHPGCAARIPGDAREANRAARILTKTYPAQIAALTA